MNVNAITLNISDMSESMFFYQELLGFDLIYGGTESSFSTLKLSDTFINLNVMNTPIPTGWGRFIVHVFDVDQFYEKLKYTDVPIENPPMNASWGERYIHILDPDGHALSLATPI
tara:strand:- start:29290 stop:29634 length:345 start_codon:yes stop_codon:yes gene_type:complete